MDRKEVEGMSHEKSQLNWQGNLERVRIKSLR